MKKLAVLLTIAVALTATTFAQGRDLAGTWKFDATKTGPLPGGRDSAGPPPMFIKQTAKEITIGMGREDNTITFKLDGSENTVAQGKSKMEWKGDKFVATVTSQRGASSLTFFRQGAWLVLEEPAHDGSGIRAMYYSKAESVK